MAVGVADEKRSILAPTMTSGQFIAIIFCSQAQIPNGLTDAIEVVDDEAPTPSGLTGVRSLAASRKVHGWLLRQRDG